MQMGVLGAVMLGGGVGAGLRYLVGSVALRLLGAHFPWGTFFVNVLGCFAMGLLVGLMAQKLDLNPHMKAFLTTGLLGGFTTFSAFSLDIANLMERKETWLAFLYVFGSVSLAITALFAGLALARHFSHIS